MKQAEFDKLVVYTLRVELLNGKVLLYPIDTANKQRLINTLQVNSEGDIGNDHLKFLWFETVKERTVAINTTNLARVVFCFDYASVLVNPYAYRDNFNIVEKDTLAEEERTTNGEVQLHVKEERYLAQAIIYHEGKAPKDQYVNNPLQYCELSKGCLYSLDED